MAVRLIPIAAIIALFIIILYIKYPVSRITRHVDNGIPQQLSGKKVDPFRLAILDKSTSQCYALATIIDDRTGKRRRICVPGSFLVGAVQKEQDIFRTWDENLSAEETVLNNQTHIFHFKSQAALNNVRVSYTEKQVETARNLLSQRKLNNLSPSIKGATGLIKSLMAEMHTQDEQLAMGQELMEKGFIIRQMDRSGALSIYDPNLESGVYIDYDVYDKIHRHNKQKAFALIQSILGYAELRRRYIVNECNLENDQIILTVHPRDKAIIDTFSIYNHKVHGKYLLWTMLMAAANNAERFIEKQHWILQWKNSGDLVNLSMTVKNPAAFYTEDITNLRYQSWKRAYFHGKPGYEFIATTINSFGTIYFDKTGTKILLEYYNPDNLKRHFVIPGTNMTFIPATKLNLRGYWIPSKNNRYGSRSQPITL